MGTRSLTIFKDKSYTFENWNDRDNQNQILKEDILAKLYRQMDGYPTGQGRDIAEFLANKKLVNGYTSIDEEVGNFNGMGELAVRLMAHLKKVQAEQNNVWRKEKNKKELAPEDTIGSFDLVPIGDTDFGQEWEYTIEPKVVRPLPQGVREKPLDILLTVFSKCKNEVIFKGNPKKFLKELNECKYDHM
jgi:hypothetical protein